MVKYFSNSSMSNQLEQVPTHPGTWSSVLWDIRHNGRVAPSSMAGHEQVLRQFGSIDGGVACVGHRGSLSLERGLAPHSLTTACCAVDRQSQPG